MKRLKLLVVCLIVILATISNANALQKKRSADITESQIADAPLPEPAPEVQPAKEENPNIGYDNGFFIKTTDDKFKFTVNGTLQPQVYYNYVKSSTPPSSWSFKVSRARLGFSANVEKKVGVNITLNYGTSTALFSSINLYNATIDYTVAPWLTISAGTTGLPLGLKASSTGFLMIDVPIAVSQDDGGTALTTLRPAFGAPDGLGVEAAGEIGKFFYDVAVINGATQAQPAVCIPANCSAAGAVEITPASGGVESNYSLNFNNKVSTGLRLGYNIFGAVGGSEMDLAYSEDPQLTVSVGGNYQGARTDPNNSARVSWLLSGALSSAFRYKGFAVNAEGFARKTKLSSLGTAAFGELNLDDVGYYINAGYFVIPKKFEIAAMASQTFKEGPNNNAYQYGGGLNYYLYGNKAKLQLDYIRSTTYADIDSPAITKHAVELQLGTSF